MGSKVHMQALVTGDTLFRTLVSHRETVPKVWTEVPDPKCHTSDGDLREINPVGDPGLRGGRDTLRRL